MDFSPGVPNDLLVYAIVAIPMIITWVGALYFEDKDDND